MIRRGLCQKCDCDNIIVDESLLKFYCQSCGHLNKIVAKGDAPQQIENPDLTDLRKTCQSMIDDILDNTYHSDNGDRHDIYESALETIFGESIWDFIDKYTE